MVMALRDAASRAIGDNAVRRAVAVRHAFEVTLVSNEVPGRLPAGVRGVGIRSRNWHALRRLAHVPNEISFARAARRAIARLHREAPVDFVLCHGYALARFAGRPLARRLGVSYGMFMHGHIFERPPGTYDPRLTAFYRAIAPGCYRETPLLLALSESQARLAVAAGAPPERVVVTPNGLDLEDVGLASGEAAREGLAGAARGAPLRLLFVGRFGPEKGVGVLLASCAKLDERGVPFHLALIGAGPGEAEARARAVELGIAQRCDFRGALPRSALGPAYRAAEILCVPSLSEPQGNVALEGMAAGCLVVASDTGGLPSMVEDGVTGLLVPPGDPAALAERLAWAAAQRDAADEIARRGPARVAERFAWPIVGRTIVAAVERVLAAR